METHNVVCKKKKKDTLCVATLSINNGENFYHRLSALTIPSMTHYCSMVGASFHLINSNFYNTGDNSWGRNVWEKFQILFLLEIFDKVLYLDADCYVSNKCPNIFEMYSNEKIVCCTVKTTDDQINYCQANFGFSPSVNINSGVMLLDKSVAKHLKTPKNLEPKLNYGYAEEQWFAACFQSSGLAITPLHWSFNSLNENDYNIYHANLPKREDKIKTIKRIIKAENSQMLN